MDHPTTHVYKKEDLRCYIEGAALLATGGGDAKRVAHNLLENSGAETVYGISSSLVPETDILNTMQDNPGFKGVGGTTYLMTGADLVSHGNQGWIFHNTFEYARLLQDGSPGLTVTADISGIL
ncbi:MAG: hypothetical protein R6V41_12120 [Desulfobacteraceae bacterium]